jgi:undecaprenyl-diphosphatase
MMSASPARPDTTIVRVALGATAIYATLATCAHYGVLEELDQRVRERVLRRGPRVVRTARAFTKLSESAIHPILGFAASKAVSRFSGRQTYAPFIASLADFALNKGTRLFIHQHRPPGARPRRGLDRLGYPSGHTLAASAIAFTTALQLAEGRSPMQRTALLAGATVYAGAIGWTRLTLDEHWFDQVAGGFVGGIILATLVHRTAPRGPRRMSTTRD